MAKDARVTREAADATARASNDEIRQLRDRLAWASTESASLAQRLEENELLTGTLRTSLRDKDDQLELMKTSMGLIQQDGEVFRGSLERQKSDLESELREQAEAVRSLDALVLDLKSKLHEAESNNLLKDEVIAGSLGKHAHTAEELREMRQRVDTHTNELFAVIHERDTTRTALAESQAELHQLKKDYSGLKDETHQKVLLQLQQAEDQLR